MKTEKEQENTDLEKALYKVVKAALEKGGPKVAQEVIRDVLDRNYTAQVDPDKIPPATKEGVVNKSKSAESQEKGVSKLKKFMHKKRKK
jgi:hypothetical protein